MPGNSLATVCRVGGLHTVHLSTGVLQESNRFWFVPHLKRHFVLPIQNIVVAPQRVLTTSSLVSFVLVCLVLGVMKPGVMSCFIILQRLPSYLWLMTLQLLLDACNTVHTALASGHRIAEGRHLEG
jgi:hypothetical protein